MSDREKQLTHKRLPTFEAFDEIRIRIVPRFKTSGLSGDEWRHHAQTDFLFKGKVVGSAGWRNIETAVMALGQDLLRAGDSGIPDEVIALEKTKCDQPSCQNDAVGRFEIKHAFGDRGEDIVQSDYYRYFRQFCRVHIERGDCSREDSDDNYIPLDGVGPGDSTNTQESPAATVVVRLDAVEG
jgi:hypothetical protein